MAPATEATVRMAVARARQRADIVVASFHWGIEYSDLPTERQRELAHAAADAGADVVIGSHPHVLQGIEWRDRRTHSTLIAYSLGNFIFDAPNAAARRSAILYVTLSRTGVVSARIEPVTINRCQPAVAAPAERGATIADLRGMSRSLGCAVANDGALSRLATPER
jgi:poly-gamma-glutamate synthesis protein (capsule biosynthesis protein)